MGDEAMRQKESRYRINADEIAVTKGRGQQNAGIYRKKVIHPAKKRKKMDLGILIPLLLLVGIGLIMVTSASTYTSVIEDGGYMVFVKQIFFVLGGMFLMWVISKMDYRVFDNQKLAWVLMVIAVILLILVLIVGDTSNGAKRWLNIKIGTFQPSEFAKLAGCVYMASTVSQHPEVTEKKLPLFLRCILPAGLICGLTLAEPSFSAAVAVAVPMAAIIFLSVRKLRHLVPYLLAVAVLGAGFMYFVDWRFGRIIDYFAGSTPDSQITQSLLAIGSGGVLGKGLGNGIQKYLFLSELKNDFIFANVGEEFGMLGCFLVLGLYIALVWRGLRQASHSKNTFGFYYSAGVMVLIAFQVVVNIGVATALIPVTGMALPFFSAGGSSIVVLFIMMGPVLNLTRHTEFQTSILTRLLKK